jgi:hypothetical protein
MVLAVLRICDILVRTRMRIRTNGSGRPKTYGSGCGSRSGTLEHFHHSAENKSQNSHKTVEIKVFFYYLCLMEESGCISARPKNTDPQHWVQEQKIRCMVCRAEYSLWGAELKSCIFTALKTKILISFKS